MVSTHMGDLDLPQLSKAARRCHILPTIKHSLILVVQLYEAGCKVKFVKWGVGIDLRYRDQLVLKGSLNKRNGLWMVPLTHTKTLTTQLQPQVHITKEGVNFITQHHVECQNLDSITSLRRSSSQIIAYEQFSNNTRQTTSKAELAM